MNENETDALVAQVKAFKDIIDEAGPGFMNGEELKMLGDFTIDMVNKSL